MNDVFPKFIVEVDKELGYCLIIGKCTYHSQLSNEKQNVKGGGWWILNRETNTFILSKDSHDFGKASIEDIKLCIEAGNVFTNNSYFNNILGDYNFSYDTETEIIPLSTLPPQ
jgi:hypothetical protein